MARQTIFGSVRAAVDRALAQAGAKATNNIEWGPVVELYADELERADERYIQRLARQILSDRRQQHRLKGAQAQRGLKPATRTSRDHVVSILAANSARELPEVREFRKKHFPSGLIDQTDFSKWCEENLSEMFTTDAGGDLGALASALAQRYSWDVVDAELFLTTDAMPVVQSRQARLLRHPDIPALDRVILSLDPTLTKEEVLRFFREAQRLTGRPRSRTITDKHLTLAYFKLRQPTEVSDKERMRRWNARVTNDDWKYSDLKLFRRDTNEALDRVRGGSTRPSEPAPPLLKRRRWRSTVGSL